MTTTIPAGWKLVAKKTCYMLMHDGTVIATLAGPDSKENAAIIASMLAAPASPVSTVEEHQPARDWELTCHECDGSGHVYVKHQVAERKTDLQEFKDECECCEGRGFVFAFQDIPGIEEYVKTCRPAPAAAGVSRVEQDERSATHGMTLGERIAHVGGRTNAQGYIEFGSPMAVDALIQHVLRDIDCTRQEDDGAYQARYRLPGGQWSSWGHVVCGVKGHEQELRYLPGERRPAPAAGDAQDLTLAQKYEDACILANANARDAALWRAYATEFPEVSAAFLAMHGGDVLPTIKGAAITGGYVVVTPAGWDADKAVKLRDAILRIFPVNPVHTPRPSDELAAQRKGDA
ncbi:Uncharacterised protein [Achromobacter xylosoxidans]|uniref:hypothetical protein n=1 Tax=Alcaligenes xylosoxydans xylosoxydans TaxID=85698 RepID=UPI0006C07946|nr:hypothetical protein [Achromobacter xylosoxidans]CUI82921.1 Uncharacterised protein [Achromobacter xylosoxidans]